MQENTSDNSTNPTQGKQPLQDYYLNGGEKYNQPQTDPARNKKIAVAIVAAVIVVALVIIIAVSVGGNSMNGIEIVEEQLVTDPYYTTIGNYLYPIVVVKVKNTSNTTKKVSFEAATKPFCTPRATEATACGPLTNTPTRSPSGMSTHNNIQTKSPLSYSDSGDFNSNYALYTTKSIVKMENMRRGRFLPTGRTPCNRRGSSCIAIP